MFTMYIIQYDSNPKGEQKGVILFIQICSTLGKHTLYIYAMLYALPIFNLIIMMIDSCFPIINQL